MKRNSNYLWTLTAVALILAAPAIAEDEKKAGAPAEKVPAGAKLAKLEIFPQKIDVKEKYGYRQILLTGVFENGDRLDLTRMAEVTTSAANVAAVEPGGRIRAKGDGNCDLVVKFAGREVKVPVAVTGQGAAFHPSYVQDVQPILSRLGCNAGTCHGSLNGKNGFKLSLRGNDYEYDHRALTDDQAGRRFNRAAPDRSLFLLKATGAIPHVGGALTEMGSPYYNTLRAWVADGVELTLEVPRVEKIEIFPRDFTMPLPGMRQQMVVVATYTDGKVRDVSREAFVSTSNTEVTEINRNGVVTAIRRGEAAILARFEGRYDATPLVVMGDRSGWKWDDTPAYNRIDELVYGKLKKVKSLPSDLCTDAEYLRRIYLDLTGLPPTTKAIRTFLLDRRDSKIKRAEVVDRLIGNPEFVEYWTNKWSDLLQVNPKWLGGGGATALRDWIRGSVASNLPYDEFVRSVLTGSGSTLKNPPAAYYKVLREPEAVMENTTQLFLGIRFNCNKCHDHPFERWTQNNYWELASFFARVGRKDAPGSKKMPRRAATQKSIPAFEEIIYDQDKGELSKPNGQQVAPKFPYVVKTSANAKAAAEAKAKAEQKRRESLAAWVTSRENPYFAKSYVNRLWSYLIGVGLIDPVDDIRAGNPPTNPELLEYLTQEFLKSGFDSRRILKMICSSRTYQQSIATNKWNQGDDINASHALARRLQAETLFDAIHKATGKVARLPGKRPGTLAAEAGPSTKVGDGFLDLFGRPPRESACECERSTGMSLGQALNLVNGPTVAEAIKDPTNSIAVLVSLERDPKKIIEEIYLSTLSRLPTEVERNELSKAFDPNDPANVDSLEPAPRADFLKRLAAWEKSQAPANWMPLDVQPLRSEGGATLTKQKGGSILLGGKNPDTDVVTVVGYTDLKGIKGFQLEVLP
ncbi:MAG: DUF1549 and DUF1553 domain-containing protein, partial [Planctomycetota bacterium]